MSKSRTKQKDALGKGIRALLTDIDDKKSAAPKNIVASKKQNGPAVLEIPLEEIEVNPFQPRANFNEDSLADLSNSIRIHGVLQPITVKRINDNRYQLIAGERRLRASKMAELKTVPAYVRVANDQEMLEIALIENIQREDLNPVEIGISYQRLLDECQLTHEEAGERLGKKRSTITNYLRLLKLPPDIQMGLKKEFISMGHAKVLLGVDDMPLQLSIFNEVVEKGLSVRQTEALIKGQQKAKAAPQKKALPYAYQKIQDQVSSYLSTKVDLKRKRDGKGEITLNFYSDSDLERLIDLIITD